MSSHKKKTKTAIGVKRKAEQVRHHLTNCLVPTCKCLQWRNVATGRKYSIDRSDLCVCQHEPIEHQVKSPPLTSTYKHPTTTDGGDRAPPPLTV